MVYAGDITRTIPVDKTFTPRQRDLYDVVLAAHEAAAALLRPGISYRAVHDAAALQIAEGLTRLGLMQGDPAAAVEAGAHALFFVHGLGHMLGLDVHDMENYGEQHIGYTPDISRSPDFGTKYLRLARKLEAGFVLTVEPGIYFIPALIRLWEREDKFRAYICYDRLGAYLDFGGIRIEDNYLITPDGSRRLGPHIPRTTAEIEAERALAW
jgi:Xaa-Pro aminopeptidase